MGFSKNNIRKVSVRWLFTGIFFILVNVTVFSQTDYFLIVEQNPGGGLASAAAIAVISVLDDADSVSIISLAYNSTLLLPPLSRTIPDLPAIAARVLSLSVAPRQVAEPLLKYSPDITDAVIIADDEAGALAAAQLGRNNRLIIIANTALGGKNGFQPKNFDDRISYIALNSEAEPVIKRNANEVWELWEEPDPDASRKPFEEGFLEALKTINKNLTVPKHTGENFPLGGFLRVVKKSVLITTGREVVVSRKGGSAVETAYHYGAYSAFALLPADDYKVEGASVIFGAAEAPLAFWVVPVLGMAVLGLGIWLISFFINGPAPAAFNVHISKMDNKEYHDAENPVYIAKVGWGRRKIGGGCTLRDVLNKIISLNRNCSIQSGSFEFLKDNKIMFNREERKWEITKARGAASSFPMVDVTTELAGTDSFTKLLILPEKHGTHTYTLQFNRGKKR